MFPLYRVFCKGNMGLFSETEGVYGKADRDIDQLVLPPLDMINP